jgi:two-component system response regulator RegA
MANDAPLAQSLLIVEDDDILRGRLAKAFRQRGFEVQEASGVDDAALCARKEPPEYAIVDLRLHGRSGLEVVKELAELDPATVIVVLTGYGSIATALEAVRKGAADYLTKPADVEEILARFDRADANPPAAPNGEPGSTPTLARVEWEHINRVLADCGGNVSKAARLLGLHRRSLQRKLAKFPPRR